MITISQAVQRVLSESPFYTEAISEGVANYSKISRKIKPRVEKILYEKVSESSITMALHRMTTESKKKSYGTSFLNSLSDITVRSSLIEFIFTNSSDFFNVQQEVYKKLESNNEAFLNISRGVRETVVVASNDLSEEIATILDNQVCLRTIKNLSSITIRLPEESLDVPGVYYPVLKPLALDGISFVEIVSVNTEFSIIFKDDVVDQAFAIIKRLTTDYNQ